MKVYVVDDLSLDLFLTTEEDIESGHLIRPEKKYLSELNYSDFLAFLKEKEAL